MTAFLVAHYDLWRGLHIVSVIAWMAGLLYLPRLFAYHTRATPGSEMDETFKTMERKLLKIIMQPAMHLAYFFGLMLIYVDGQMRGWDFLLQLWMLTKIAGIVFLSGWQVYLRRSVKRFAAGTNTKSEKFWRMTNELPFLAAIVMVLAVTVEFGSGR
jgi:putative membrane protein